MTLRGLILAQFAYFDLAQRRLITERSCLGEILIRLCGRCGPWQLLSDGASVTRHILVDDAVANLATEHSVNLR